MANKPSNRPVSLSPAIALLGVLLASPACTSLPEIPLTTPEPIKVAPIEVQVRIDLYQHGQKPAEAVETAIRMEEIVERQRNRMAEIQELKDNRLVGENHRGLLEVRNLPGGDYGNYVKKTVKEENRDRTYMMRAEAQRRDLLLARIEEEQWIRRSELSFQGEWLEIADPEKEGGFRWKRKE